MASSLADSLPSPAAFALQEVIACWDQAYEALTRGDLDRVHELLDLVDERLPYLPPATADGPAEATLREQAQAARGRLEHGLRAGLDGIGGELAKARNGARVLKGYGAPGRTLGGRVESRA